jgi:hypothetical protein
VRAFEASRWLVALLAVTGVAYLGALGAGFVWDDLPLVVGNELAGSPRNLAAIFRTDLWSTAGVHVPDPPYYRPLVVVTLLVDRMLGGLSPAVHHADSIAWHLAAVAAVFALARTLVSPAAALAAAAVFALHPVQSEAVVWVSARSGVMAAFFVARAATVLAPLDASWRRSGAGAALLLAGLLSKEDALSGVVLVGLLDLGRHGRLGGPRRYAAMGGAVALWAVLRHAAGVGASRALSPQRIADVQASLLDIVGIYGRLLVWPDPLTHGRRLFFLHEGAAAAGVVGAGIVAVLVLVRGGRLAACALAYAALCMSATLLGIGSTHQVGERYLYLPMVGIAIAIASALGRARVLVPVGAGLALACVLRIERRLPDWESPLSLASSAVRDYPSGAASGEMALALRDEGEIAAAMDAFHAALTAEPPSYEVCAAYVETPLVLGDAPKALDAAIETIERRCPVSPELSARHALAFARSERWEEARASVAIAERGGDPSFWLEVAIELAERDDDSARAAALRRRFPGDP